MGAGRFSIATTLTGLYYRFITAFSFHALQTGNLAEIWHCTCLSVLMTNSEERDWRKLCELAAKETDPEKLYALVEKLNRALEVRAQRRKGQTPNDANRDPDPPKKHQTEGRAQS